MKLKTNKKGIVKPLYTVGLLLIAAAILLAIIYFIGTFKDRKALREAVDTVETALWVDEVYNNDNFATTTLKISQKEHSVEITDKVETKKDSIFGRSYRIFKDSTKELEIKDKEKEELVVEIKNA